MGLTEVLIPNPSPRSGRMTIAQHLSAGISKSNNSQSVKRTAGFVIHQANYHAFQSSVSRTVVRELGIPALKCWAIVIRPLRGLFNYFLCKTTLRSVFLCKTTLRSVFLCKTTLRSVLITAVVATLLVVGSTAQASSTFEDYEGRLISSIEITFEGSPPDPSAEAEFLSIIGILPNSEFSAVSIRKSLQDLFNSERVANARVEVIEATGQNGSTRGPLRLRYVIAAQAQIL